MADAKMLVVHEMLKTERKPFKPRSIRDKTGLSSQHINYYLKTFLEHGSIIKEGSYYRVLDLETLLTELEGGEKGRPLEIRLSADIKAKKLKEMLQTVVARRALGEEVDEEVIKYRDYLDEYIERLQEARKYLLTKTLTEVRAKEILERGKETE